MHISFPFGKEKALKILTEYEQDLRHINLLFNRQDILPFLLSATFLMA